MQPTTPVQPAYRASQVTTPQPQETTQSGFVAQQATPTFSNQPITSTHPKAAPKPSFLNGAGSTASSAGTTSTVAPVTTARPQTSSQENDGSIKIPEFLKRR